MTIERRNPLPVGRYWLDLIGPDKIANFSAAVKGLNTAHPGILHVISTTHHEADENQEQNQTGRSWLQVVLDSAGAIVWGEGQPTPERDWVLFEVTSQAVWPRDLLGSPAIAGPEITSEGDTVQRPPPEKDVTDQISDALRSSQQAVQTIGLVIGGAILVTGILIALTKFGGSKS